MEAALGPTRHKTLCSSCNLRELCLPAGLTPSQVEMIDQLVRVRQRVKRGESLFRSGDAFRSLYAVWRGFFKMRVAIGDGRDQVSGFSMAGELLGIDGIGTGLHDCDAVALEDSEVCVIPYNRLEEMFRSCEPLQRHFHQIMSREIVRDHGVMLLLGSMRADERLATFLLNLSVRLTARGYSPSEFMLRMTRGEIGSFLGMTVETVSRTLSKFQLAGLIGVDHKHVRINDIPGLRELLQRRATPLG